ncbi:hypothetical protein JYG23_04610 [Sedimentibacter sp. zth1]|uniref:hypothetical protein n=1 Tax=Sedimentibacter sp. zth1 TaxID=2816908 RepID=UPI001A91470D|nr:hypothetical protein [Sedimentibacter sp. zth1]QSX06732.1 hypothetical protein JYG23_04610 [Sedimentibacter sp. zth1]
MLIIEAEILFDTPDTNETALDNDLDTKYAIRPAINFGNDLLFSGDIKVDSIVKQIKRGRVYNVSIEMPTIEDEAYEAIKSLLIIGNNFKIQSASRLVGKGTINDYVYM